MKFILFIILFSATPTLHLPALTGKAVWNVGQGQWFTAISNLHCYHFDLGGEMAPLNKVIYHCKHRKNVVFLSHWDWDHISFLRTRQFRSLKDICIAQRPQGKASPSKMRLLASYKNCEKSLHNDSFFQDRDSKLDSQLYINTYSNPPKKIHTLWSPTKFRSPNESSHVSIYEDWLLPGDSPRKQEKIWSQKKHLQNIQFLLLGHHGSHTSTSEDLLRKLPRLQMAISSARFQKHGHPHPQVQGRLHVHKVALLKTEDWGNIWFL